MNDFGRSGGYFWVVQRFIFGTIGQVRCSSFALEINLIAQNRLPHFALALASLRGIEASQRRNVETSREKGGGLKAPPFAKRRSVETSSAAPFAKHRSVEASKRRSVAREERAFRPSLRASSICICYVSGAPRNWGEDQDLEATSSTRPRTRTMR